MARARSATPTSGLEIDYLSGGGGGGGAPLQPKAPEPAIRAATVTLTGTPNLDTLFGGATDDVIVGLGGNDGLFGGAGGDTLFGGDRNDYVYGGQGPDTLFGDAGNDTLFDGSDVDSLFGGAGDDTLFHEEGSSDELYGAGGNDYAAYSNQVTAFAFTQMTFAGGAQTDTLALDVRGRPAGFYDIGGSIVATNAVKIMEQTQVEVFEFLGSGASDTLRFATAGAIVTLRFLGGTGSDTLFAGAGGSDQMRATAFGGSGNDTLFGASANDTLLGGSGDDSFAGNAGDDVYVTGYDQGSDSVRGGSGSDVFQGIGSATQQSGWTLDMAGTGFIAALDGGHGLSRVQDVERIYLSGSLQSETFTITGGFGAGPGNIVTGITIAMGGGDDLYQAGAASGMDSVSAEVDGGAGNDTVNDGSGLEAFLGGDGDDVFNQLAGGNDTIIGGSGHDRVVMDQQSDPFGVNVMTFAGDSGIDQIDYHASARDAVHWVFNKEFFSVGGDTLFQYFDAETFDLRGSLSGADTLQIDPQGSMESIRFFGEGGNDTLFVTHSGTDIARITAFGGTGADSLTGGSAADTFFGGAGADSIFGQFGDDVIHYDAADLRIIGGSGKDTLVGTAGADVIQVSQAKYHFAGAGASLEVLLLGDGNDAYNGPSDLADFAGFLGGGVSVYGGSGNDNLNMRGNGALAGNNDLVSGGAGNDNLWGGGGADDLRGDDGDDALYGGYGDDRFSGGSGFDVAYVGRGEGADQISDSEGLVLFWGNEPIGGFHDGVDPGEISIAYGATQVTITFLGDGNSVTFDKGSVEILNLFDFANGDAGNGKAPPPLHARDIWSASWDSGAQTFTAFTKVVDA